MKITFSLGGGEPGPAGEVASRPSASCLWSGRPMAPHNPMGSLAWGIPPWGVPGRGYRGCAGARAAGGAASWYPHGWSLLSLVPFPVHCSGMRCWEENPVC